MQSGGRQLTITGFALVLRKGSLRLGFLMQDSLCMASCNDTEQALFCLKKLGVGAGGSSAR